MAGPFARKTFTAVAAIDDAARTVRFKITNGAEDRDGDRINPNGWELEDYKRSPVVLWAHDHSMPPIAQAIDIVRTGDGLLSTAKFPAAGINPFADMIFELVKGGFIRACSVGFSAIESVRSERGTNFIRQSLHEWSIVPVGANANALVSAAAAGIETKQLRDWAKRVLDGKDDWIDLDIIEPSEKVIDVDIAPEFAAALERRRMNPANLAGLTIDVEKHDLRGTLERVLERQMRALRPVLHEAVERAVNQMRGRVD